MGALLRCAAIWLALAFAFAAALVPVTARGPAEDHIRQCAHRDGERDGRQIRGHPHRSEPRRHHGRRSRRRRRQSADRPRAVDPRQEDRHHARHGLRRGQEAGRHFRRRGVLRRLAAGRGDRALHRRRHQGVLDQRPHHAQRHLAGRRHARQGGHDRQAVRAGRHQHRSGDCSRSRSCWKCASSKPSRQAGRELGVQWNVFGNRSLANVGNQVPASQLPVTAPNGSFQQPC